MLNDIKKMFKKQNDIDELKNIVIETMSDNDDIDDIESAVMDDEETKYLSSNDRFNKKEFDNNQTELENDLKKSKVINEK